MIHKLEDLDISLANKILDWKPKITLIEGLKKLLTTFTITNEKVILLLLIN